MTGVFVMEADSQASCHWLAGMVLPGSWARRDLKAWPGPFSSPATQSWPFKGSSGHLCESLCSRTHLGDHPGMSAIPEWHAEKVPERQQMHHHGNASILELSFPWILGGWDEILKHVRKTGCDECARIIYVTPCWIKPCAAPVNALFSILS